jgi:hypothetical protein
MLSHTYDARNFQNATLDRSDIPADNAPDGATIHKWESIACCVQSSNPHLIRYHGLQAFFTLALGTNRKPGLPAFNFTKRLPGVEYREFCVKII